jgi:hypothetical protein
MRFNEFKQQSYKANKGTVALFKKKQALQDNEELQRRIKRKEYNDGVVDKVTANVLAAVLEIIHADAEAETASTIKTKFV